MKKEIYKEIPENFHHNFCQTLSRLEDTPSRTRLHGKKLMVLLAVAVLACASVTAAAAGIMEWHKRMSEHFGTEKELEDKLSMENVAIPQNTGAEGNGLKFQALQAVRTGSCVYFLIEMTVPENVQWNEDIIFEECEAVGGDYGCTANFVDGSLEDGSVLLELQLLYNGQEITETEKVCICLKNLVQTQKTDIVEYLAEGEWKIDLTLPPAEADTVSFFPESTLILGDHRLSFTKVDISPFRVRLYTDRELALHAAWGHSVFLAGVWYKDGTVVEENGMSFSLSGHQDEAGDFYFETPLDNAVDTDKIAGVLISDGKEERKFPLLHKDAQQEKEVEIAALPAGVDNESKVLDVKLLYVKYENAVLEEDGAVWLWDARCDRRQKLFSLEELGFSWEKGGEISMGQGSQVLVLPYAGSEKVYLYDIAGQNMLTLDAETFWPWPVHESYKECCRDIAEIISDADERYSSQAFFSQGNWYCLYSEDGYAKNMELKGMGASSP